MVVQRLITRRRVAVMAAVGTLAASPMFMVGAQAQDVAKDYPTKAITFVVPFAAGGSSDTRARQIAEKLTRYFGKPVVVDNRAGAGGNIGTEYIARAKPDGYTIGIGNFGPMSVNKALFAKLGYDPAKDLAPIALVEKGPLVLLVSADKSPYKTYAQFAAYAKANKDKLSYGSAGSGSAYHLAGEVLEDAVPSKMAHVPYRGGGPATNDLIAGTIDFMFDMAPSTLQYITSTPPRMRALGVASPTRVPALPDVPTFKELGVPEMTDMSNWFGVIAPAGVPQPIIAKLNDAVNRALKEPDLAQRIVSQGNVIGGGTPEAFKAFYESESERWAKVVKEKGIKPE
jgi:tripartite-type tricarboxylate transporter receptor subunit TctC